jgi:hypothetical protein
MPTATVNQTSAKRGDGIGGTASGFFPSSATVGGVAMDDFGYQGIAEQWAGGVGATTPLGPQVVILNPGAIVAGAIDVLASTVESTGYQTVAAALALAATILPSLIPAFLASANAAFLGAALTAGADDIDGEVIQGRKYDLSQARQFPRVAYETGAPLLPADLAVLTTPQAQGATVVWDFDTDGVTVIVPLDVRKAEIFQANFRLTPGANRIIAARRQGLAAQSVGDMAESYVSAVGPGEWGASLCQDAYQLMKKYRLKSGRLQ